MSDGMISINLLTQSVQWPTDAISSMSCGGNQFNDLRMQWVQLSCGCNEFNVLRMQLKFIEIIELYWNPLISIELYWNHWTILKYINLILIRIRYGMPNQFTYLLIYFCILIISTFRYIFTSVWKIQPNKCFCIFGITIW